MSLHLAGNAEAAAREREKAAARSTKLTVFFNRLAAADALARRRGSAEIDDDAEDGDGSTASPSRRVGRSPDQRRRVGASQTNFEKTPVRPMRRTAVPFCGRDEAAAGGSGGTGVFSADSSRRLPPAFREQARVLSSVDETMTEMQGTLQQLHRDLAVHDRGRHNDHRGNARIHANRRGAGSASNSSWDVDGGFCNPSLTSAAAQRHMAEEEAKVEQLRIQRARAAAADEGASDDQSVEDYGVDCEIPPLTAESRLVDEVASVAEHFTKARASALAMAEVEELAPTTSGAPWWSSALRLRGMKAAAARLDYHARAALGWSHRAREQLLLQVAHLNNVSATTRTQLLQQQQHWQEFQTRLKEGQQAITQMQAATALWQAQLQEETQRRARLQEELLTAAQKAAVVNAAETNHLKAELALLLTEREWPSQTLQHDAQTVLEWLKSVSTPLE